MSTISRTRVLFLDDSGKPHPRDSSGAVVIAGFSIPSEHVQLLHRRIAGAKSRFFPQRGDPSQWEIKASKMNGRRRRRTIRFQRFVDEVLRILGSLDCTVYSVSMDKRNMAHVMELSATMPLQLQVLIGHFTYECEAEGGTGMIVSDWSEQGLDSHANKCVASFVITRRLNHHPGVYYTDSAASHAIQVADLIAGVRRRAVEGDTDMQRLDSRLAAIRSSSATTTGITQSGRPYENRISLF